MRTHRPTRRLVATLGAAGLLAALALPATAFAADCDVLVTHTPTSSEGNRYAVAITSQSLDADRDGWVHVGWEAAEGTSISEVTLHREDGDEQLTGGDLTTGYAENVLELSFCGEGADTPSPSATGSTNEPKAAEQKAAGPSSTQAQPAEEPEAPASGAAAPSADTDAPAASTSQEPAATPDATEATEEAPQAPAEPRRDEAVTSKPDPQDEVEVLGVSLSADGSHEVLEQPSRATDGEGALSASPATPATTSNTTPLLAGGLAGLLAAVAALTGARRLHREAK